MLKSKVFINILLVLTILLFHFQTDSSIAGDCDNVGSSSGTPTFSGNFIYPPGYECPKNPSLEYDTANSSKNIVRNGSASLVVIGNNGPYTWSVSGAGFTLETEGQPTGPTNTLYADGTACGTAAITVTGCSGPQAIGYVLCTSGVWRKVTDCYSSYPHCSHDYNCAYYGQNTYENGFYYGDGWCHTYPAAPCDNICGINTNECPTHTIYAGGFKACFVARSITCQWVCSLDGGDPCEWTH